MSQWLSAVGFSALVLWITLAWACPALVATCQHCRPPVIADRAFPELLAPLFANGCD